MEIADPDNSQYIQLAIQTVLFLNRDRIHLSVDANNSDSLIKEISEEIMLRARKFKELTASIEKSY